MVLPPAPYCLLIVITGMFLSLAICILPAGIHPDRIFHRAIGKKPGISLSDADAEYDTVFFVLYLLRSDESYYRIQCKRCEIESTVLRRV